MQYAVFVYVSSAQAVIQDLFLFLFKTKDRERSEPNKPREKRAPYYGGKKNQKEQKIMQKRIFYIFFAKNLFMSKKSSIFALEISKSFPFMGQQSKNTILC